MAEAEASMAALNPSEASRLGLIKGTLPLGQSSVLPLQVTMPTLYDTVLPWNDTVSSLQDTMPSLQVTMPTVNDTVLPLTDPY